MRQVLVRCCLLWSLCGAVAGLQAAAAPVAREQAPFDLGGYWVSLVTEDWRYRMQAAAPGDAAGIALTRAGQELAAAWNPEVDVASGAVCKAYGAGGLLRLPTRLHLTWLSDNVLSMATDAGRQTRLFKFGPAQDQIGIGSLQGVSHARWELDSERDGSGALVVETSRMAPGYLRRNGIPYGDKATLTEYFELLEGADGTDYLVVISVLEDPQYLAAPVVTSSNFRREPDGTRWAPSDCEP
jgi:hypothetical protein